MTPHRAMKQSTTMIRHPAVSAALDGLLLAACVAGLYLMGCLLG